jgi:hypothetical protein
MRELRALFVSFAKFAVPQPDLPHAVITVAESLQIHALIRSAQGSLKSANIETDKAHSLGAYLLAAKSNLDRAIESFSASYPNGGTA